MRSGATRHRGVRTAPHLEESNREEKMVQSSTCLRAVYWRLLESLVVSNPSAGRTVRMGMIVSLPGSTVAPVAPPPLIRRSAVGRYCHAIRRPQTGAGSNDRRRRGRDRTALRSARQCSTVLVHGTSTVGSTFTLSAQLTPQSGYHSPE